LSAAAAWPASNIAPPSPAAIVRNLIRSLLILPPVENASRAHSVAPAPAFVALDTIGRAAR
jgi:hypothetical protein